MPTDLPRRTFEFAKEIIAFSKHLRSRSAADRVILNQLLRCGSSIGAQVEEGQASQSRADFLCKFSIACREARETLYWLRLLDATGPRAQPQMAELIAEANELVAILTTIMRRTRTRIAAERKLGTHAATTPARFSAPRPLSPISPFTIHHSPRVSELHRTPLPAARHS